MRVRQSMRRWSLTVLSTSIVFVIVLFGLPADYSSGAYYGIVAVQVSLICLASWFLGAFAIRDAMERRMLAVAGVLLLAPWALFSFLAGVGPPGNQSAADNELRYLVLLLSAMSIAGGLIVLKEALRDAGEHFYSTLGLAATLVATPMYLIWASLMLQDFRGLYSFTSDEIPQWIQWIRDLTDVLLFFGGASYYLAALLFAAALLKVKWLGRKLSLFCVLTNAAALISLIFRGLQSPNPATLQWFEIPGFVFGIPAIPWIVPCIFGIALLHRAGIDPDPK